MGAGRGQLRERSLHASAVLLNRAVGAPPPWLGALGDKIAAEPALGDALTGVGNTALFAQAACKAPSVWSTSPCPSSEAGPGTAKVDGCKYTTSRPTA